jgi:hypothetical protein
MQELIEVIRELQENIININKAIPIDVALWDSDTIATYLRRSPRSMKNITPLPDFPKPIVLPSAGNGRNVMKLWKAVEVISWTEGYQQKEEGRRGRRRVN